MTLHPENQSSGKQLDGPRALRPEEHSSAMQLLNSVLRPNGPSDILKEYPLALGTGNIENMRVMVQGKKVLSHAAIYFSTLLSGNLAFKVGVIGSVATHPEHRRQRLGSAIIRDSIRIMEEAGCHLSVLWTQRKDFYRSFGYESAGQEYLFSVKPSEFRHISTDCKVVDYSPEHLPAVIEIHNRETLRTERAQEEWQAYLGIPKTRILLALRNGKATAYAVMGKGEDFRRCILEWGGNAQDTLCLVREFVLAAGHEIMLLAPAYSNEFTRLLEQMRLPKVFEYLAMIRIIDVDAISALVRDYVSGRLGADFQILKTGTGSRIVIGETEVPVKPENALPRILFGPDVASGLLPALPSKMASALDKALPVPLFIWGLDSV
jgi:N-acetylglutamate synthase-like GNAT family acetyltransferase